MAQADRSQNNYLSKREVYKKSLTLKYQAYRLKITTSQRERFISELCKTILYNKLKSQNNYLSKREVYKLKLKLKLAQVKKSLKITTSQRERFIDDLI